MAYNQDPGYPRINHYSSPFVRYSYNGFKMPTGTLYEANNVAVINYSKYRMSKRGDESSVCKEGMKLDGNKIYLIFRCYGTGNYNFFVVAKEIPTFWWTRCMVRLLYSQPAGWGHTCGL